ALDEELARQGYATMDVTHVLALCLAERVGSPSSATVWQPASLGDWVDAYREITLAPAAQRAAHMRILHASAGQIVLACTGAPGNPTGCALGIVEADTVGLYDIAVRSDVRRQGVASALVGSLLNAGQAMGARWAYLQVTKANVPARRLYERFGFAELYRYWYRQKPAAGG
ncbi:MAG: GNAT family N-acetyltransferase, partial [Anaerolineae bacterium]